MTWVWTDQDVSRAEFGDGRGCEAEWGGGGFGADGEHHGGGLKGGGSWFCDVCGVVRMLSLEVNIHSFSAIAKTGAPVRVSDDNTLTSTPQCSSNTAGCAMNQLVLESGHPECFRARL